MPKVDGKNMVNYYGSISGKAHAHMPFSKIESIKLVICATFPLLGTNSINALQTRMGPKVLT